MQLGKRAQIAIGVPDIVATAAFFRQTGFHEIDSSNEPYPWIQFSDGQNLILLNQDGMVYRGLIYFNPALDALVPQLEAAGIDLIGKRSASDGGYQAVMFSAPTSQDQSNDNSIGVNIVAHDPAGLHAPAGEPLTLLGKFGEFATFTTDFAEVTAFWQQLGYEELLRASDPYPWGILRDGPIVLGVHQAPADHKLSDTPALTYFALDAGERIARVKALGYTPAFEMTDEDGQTAHAGFIAPGGQMFFIFQGEI